MRNRDLAMTLQAAGRPAHQARAQARRLARMVPRPQTVAPEPIAPPMPIDPSTRHIGDRARRAINAKAAGLMASGMTQADADAWANAAVEGFRSTMADRDRVH